MRPSVVSSSLVLFAFLASPGRALEALVNSPCAVQCGNDLGGTSGSDIVCPDSEYTSTQAGQTFQTCLTCQMSSKYVDPVTNTSDLQWGLYNLRYAMSWCIWGYPDSSAPLTDTPCLTHFSCGPLETSIESLATNETEYDYCGNDFTGSTNIYKCSQCLIESSLFYLGNFVTALSAGCIQQPTPGNTISVQGSLFSTQTLNITSPSATPSGGSVSKGPLTLGATVGIVVGGIIFGLIVTGFCIICQGKRRRRAQLLRIQEESGYLEWRKSQGFSPEEDFKGATFATLPTPQMSSAQYFDSPSSQRPLHSWAARPGMAEDESPATTIGEKVYFSPYTSNYTSPVSASDAIQPMGREWMVERKTDLHEPVAAGMDWPIDRKSSVASGSGSGRERVRSRSRGAREEKEGDQFELQDVAPVVLKHPGLGRVSPGDSVALTEDDAKRGDAL